MNGVLKDIQVDKAFASMGNLVTEAAFGKALIGAIVGVGAYLAGCINVLLVVVVGLIILDYITGVTLALLQGTFDKEVGIKGAVKKLFYGVLVLLGFLIDLVVITLADIANLGFSTGGLFGIAVALYLIGTEGLSIIKSLVLMGVPVPDFIRKAFGYMKDHSGKIVKIPEESVEDDCSNQ